MKVNITQLSKQLDNYTDNLPAIVMVSGDEPLQLNEACDHARRTAKKLGYSDRQVFHVESGFDWDNLLAESNTLSLFSDKRLLELRIPNGKPGDKGSKALVGYCNNLPPDTVLLIICGKLEAASQKSKWFKHIENSGVVCQVWPVEPANMPAWINKRMQRCGLNPTGDAVALLSERVEGNLLAASQEIDKLSLLFGKSQIGIDEVLAAVSDNARYTIFELADASLAGDIVRSTRILHGLRAEGSEPILVLWAMTREIRALALMGADIQQGNPMDSVLFKHRVWEKRKPLFKRCLQSSQPSRWQNLLIKCSSIDKLIKGAETGNIWDELLQLSLQVANIKPAVTRPVNV